MSTLSIIVVISLLAMMIGAVVYRRLPRRLKAARFHDNWKELQLYCKDKKTWPNALQEADALFDSALKKRKYKGKRMGERMVAAQREITNNDQVWFAHNLAKKVQSDPKTRLKERDVKAALIGFRQALKDLGALPTQERAMPQDQDKKAAS